MEEKVTPARGGRKASFSYFSKIWAKSKLAATRRINATKPLFVWECLEDSPTLATLKEFLAAIPDGKLLASLRQARGKGRDDYPVQVLWGVLLLTSALRHPTIEACLAELRRNAGLRRLIGIESEDQVPKKWNVSRFQEVLGQEPHRTHLKAIFSTMVQKLGSVGGASPLDCAWNVGAQDGTKCAALHSRAGGEGAPQSGSTLEMHIDSRKGSTPFLSSNALHQDNNHSHADGAAGCPLSNCVPMQETRHAFCTPTTRSESGARCL